jgi:ABC-type microcin C transport system permease subunit YejB
MALAEFSDHETQQMLQAVRNWLRTQRDQQEGTSSGASVTLDADAVESFGSDFGLDKPSSHRLLIDLAEEGYLDAECHTSESEVTPLRYADVRILTDKALEKLS